MTNANVKMTKVAQAKQIVEAHPAATRSELVKMFMEQLSMSKAGATTYGYNLAKNAAKRVRKADMVQEHAKPKAKKASKKAEATLLPGIPEKVTKEQEAMYDEVARKLQAKRERDAQRKREKRAAEKAAKEKAA
jgi:hypothetical protein